MKIDFEETSKEFNPIEIIITIESLEELESLRSLFGGVNVRDSIKESFTPDVSAVPAIEFVSDMAAICNDKCKELGLFYV